MKVIKLFNIYTIANKNKKYVQMVWSFEAGPECRNRTAPQSDTVRTFPVFLRLIHINFRLLSVTDALKYISKPEPSQDITRLQ